MNKKSVIRSIIIAAAIVFAVCFFLYERYDYLPVLGRMIAKSKMEAYTGNTLSVYYNTKDRIYEGIDAESNTYAYDIRKNMIYDWDGIHYPKTIEKDINNQYKEFLELSLFDSVDFPESPSVIIGIDANDHSKIYVKFTLLNAKEPVHLNEEKSKERMREILESLCSNVSYNITRIQFGYDNLDGVYQVSYDNGKKPITQSRWMDHIEKYPEDHLSLMYLEWREENLAKENK